MSQLLAKNIRFLMHKHDIKNPNDLAKRTKIPQPTLFRWMVEAAREPRNSSLKPLAEFFGVEIKDLMETDFETGETFSEVSLTQPRREVFVVPFDKVASYAGGVKPADHKHLSELMSVLQARVSPNAYGLLVRGDAMSPTFPEGAHVVVDPNRAARHGDYVVASEPKTHAPVLRRMVQEGGYVYLQPDNPRYETVRVDGEPQIFGVVVEMQIVHVF